MESHHPDADAEAENMRNSILTHERRFWLLVLATLWVLVLIAGISGCESLGLTAPKTTKERLLYAAAERNALMKTVDTLNLSGRISDSQALRAADASKAASSHLRAGLAALEVNDAASAEGALMLALQAIAVIREVTSK